MDRVGLGLAQLVRARLARPESKRLKAIERRLRAGRPSSRPGVLGGLGGEAVVAALVGSVEPSLARLVAPAMERLEAALRVCRLSEFTYGCAGAVAFAEIEKLRPATGDARPMSRSERGALLAGLEPGKTCLGSRTASWATSGARDRPGRVWTALPPVDPRTLAVAPGLVGLSGARLVLA
jgi:hypothetical protein